MFLGTYIFKKYFYCWHLFSEVWNCWLISKGRQIAVSVCILRVPYDLEGYISLGNSKIVLESLL